jgi:hypothetical protein
MYKNILYSRKRYQNVPLQGLKKYTHIWIFGKKINHLAILLQTAKKTFSVRGGRGTRLGEFLAHWVILFFGQFSEN